MQYSPLLRVDKCSILLSPSTIALQAFWLEYVGLMGNLGSVEEYVKGSIN